MSQADVAMSATALPRASVPRATEAATWRGRTAVSRTARSSVLGVVGGPAAGTTHLLALVRATARVAEHELVRHLGVGTRVVHRPSQVAPVRLSVLGRDRALLDVDGHVHQLTPRHSEIVLLLTSAPDGLSAEAIAGQLSPEGLHPTSIRVEISRLRRQLGEDLLDARPYALLRPLRCDLNDVEALVTSGRVAEAFEVYTGPPLPGSAVPGIVARRQELHEALRNAVLTSYNVRLLRRWVATPDGATDAAAWETLASLLPVGSRGRDEATARATQLR